MSFSLRLPGNPCHSQLTNRIGSSLVSRTPPSAPNPRCPDTQQPKAATRRRGQGQVTHRTSSPPVPKSGRGVSQKCATISRLSKITFERSQRVSCVCTGKLNLLGRAGRGGLNRAFSVASFSNSQGCQVHGVYAKLGYFLDLAAGRKLLAAGCSLFG